MGKLTGHSGPGRPLLIMGLSVLVAGCSQGGSTDSGAVATSSAATSDPSVTSLAPGTAPATGEAVSPSSTGGEKPCRSADLTAALQPVAGSDGAGHQGYDVVLTYRGSGVCVLQGWPGVSLVGRNRDDQLGAPAELNRDSAHDLVALTSGRSAKAALNVATPENFGEACHPAAVGGVRVYPPGQTQSLIIRADGVRDLTGCQNAATKLLAVDAVRNG